LAKRVKRIILPFAVAAKDRYKPFTKDMEMAAIYYLAERDRKKGEGRVLKKPEEKLVFIAQTCYPLWLIPWRRMTLIFDGLEFSNKSLFYDVIPDIKTFETDLQASSRSREAYMAALSQNSSYFQKFSGKEEKRIEGLITNPEFTNDLLDYIQVGEDMEKGETTKAILAPLLEESEVLVSVDKLSEAREIVDEEIKSLGRTMKLLSRVSKIHVKALEREMERSKRVFDTKIKKVKPKVMAKIKKIRVKRDENVTRISKKHARKLHSLHQSRVRIERILERFSTTVDRCEQDIKGCRDRKDEAGEFQLCQKLDEIKKKIPVLNKEIKDIDREIENVEEAKKIEVSRARIKLDDQVEEAMKVLHDIEAEKEARIRLEEQEMESLEDMSSSIIKQIDTLIKAKEVSLSEFDEIGTQERNRSWVIVYLPIYFVCYETEVGKRYVVYPPSTIGSMGIKTKLKGVLGGKKMKSFLQSRSPAIGGLLDRLVDLTQENPVFEKEITMAGIKANILGATELRVGIKRGIVELRDENWISESQCEVLSKLE
jgi:hypothetical protein